MRKFSIWLIGVGMQKRLGDINATHINAARDTLLAQLQTIFPEYKLPYHAVRNSAKTLDMSCGIHVIRIVDEEARKVEQRAIQSLFALPKP